MKKQMTFLSHSYPNQIRIRIGGLCYTYHAEEFFCRRFIHAYRAGGRFNTLNWFKRVARLVEKEVR